MHANVKFSARKRVMKPLKNSWLKERLPGNIWKVWMYISFTAYSTYCISSISFIISVKGPLQIQLMLIYYWYTCWIEWQKPYIFALGRGHGKKSKDDRRKIFQDKMKRVNQHNSRNPSFCKALNKFSAMVITLFEHFHDHLIMVVGCSQKMK